MIVWNKIWDEIVHADANQICARRYANVQRRIAVGYKIAIPLLSGLCAVAVKYDQPNAAFWTAVILCISTIIKAVFPQLILPGKDVMALDKLHISFMEYRNEVEQLMSKLEGKRITEDEAIKEFDSLQKTMVKKKGELNKLVLWIPWFVDRSITKESERYLNAIHKNKYEE